MATRSWCDSEDERTFADGDVGVTCQACIDAKKRGDEAWHKDQRERLHRRASQADISGEFDTSDTPPPD